MRIRSAAWVVVALWTLGCPASEVSDPPPQQQASTEFGADALAVRALVAKYLERTPEEIDWDTQLASLVETSREAR